MVDFWDGMERTRGRLERLGMEFLISASSDVRSEIDSTGTLTSASFSAPAGELFGPMEVGWPQAGAASDSQLRHDSMA